MLKISFILNFLMAFLFANHNLLAQEVQPSVSPVPTPLVVAPESMAISPQSMVIMPEPKLVTSSTGAGSNIAPIESEASVNPSLSTFPIMTAPEWKLEGGFGFKTYLQPSSNYSKNNFSGASLNILGRKALKKSDSQLQNEYFVQGSFDLLSKTESQSGHFFPVLRDAFVESRNSEVSRFFRLGYFLSPMLERERSFWQGYRLGVERAGLWERYSYLKTTDAGFEYGSLSTELQWRVGFANTDAEKATPMIQKDIFLLWEVLPQAEASFYGGMSFVKGWYEGLPLNTNNKDRGFIWWGYRNPNGLQFTFEGFSAIDAVDGLKTPVAEGADFSLKAGELVRAFGGAFLIGQNFEWNSQKFRLDFKLEQLDPDIAKALNSVKDSTIAISVPNEVGQFTLSLENMELEKSHSIGNKQRTSIRVDYTIDI
jgi:hypothetical protein